MSYFQIQLIKCPVQNNEISTCLLWCLCDYHVAFHKLPAVLKRLLLSFAWKTFMWHFVWLAGFEIVGIYRFSSTIWFIAVIVLVALVAL